MITSRQDSVDTPTVVVGLDPGLANLGLGVVRSQGRDTVYIDSQLVRTSSRKDQSARLRYLFEQVDGFFAEHRPDALAIEGQFFHQRGDISFKVGQAFGVCLLAASQRDIPVFEYGPMEVKQTLVGTGKASKAQVGYMVRALLNMTRQPPSNHVADALALALTHLSYQSLRAKL